MTPPRSDVEVLRELLVGVELDAQYDPLGEAKIRALTAAIEVMEGKGWRQLDTLPVDGEVFVWRTYDGDIAVESVANVRYYREAAKRDNEECVFGGWLPMTALPTPPQPNEEKGK